MKHLKKILVIFVFTILVWIVGGGDRVYADDSQLKIYEYDYTNKIMSENEYAGGRIISGLTSFNVMAMYEGENAENISYEWYPAEDSKYLVTVTSTGTNMCIGRVVGIGVGPANVVVNAVDNGQVVGTRTFSLVVSSTELRTATLPDLYVDGANITLPTDQNIINDYYSVNQAHPRILTNSTKMQLADKYLTYALAIEKEQTERNEYENLVINEINSKYKGEQVPIEYFRKMADEYNVIQAAAGSYVAVDTVYTYEYVSGSISGVVKKMEAETEQVGYIWLLYNARMQNINQYKASFSSEEAYNNVVSIYQDKDYNAYAERLKKILAYGTQFKDWNPKDSFLDTGMMSYVMGLTYDWVYSYLTEDERAQFAADIKRLGIEEGNSYIRCIYSQQRFRSNWSAVYLSGISTASMAVFEYYPQMCGRQIADTVRFLPVFINQYSPGGALSEGTGYWILSERYISYLLSSLNYTFKNDYGLLSVKGLDESMFYPLYITGKDSIDLKHAVTYNFGDANGGEMAQSAMLWYVEAMSEKTKNEGSNYKAKAKALLWYKMRYTDENNYNMADVQDLLWYPIIISRYKNLLVSPEAVTYEDLKQSGMTELKYFASTDNITNTILCENDLMSDNIVFGRGEKVTIVTSSKDYTDIMTPYFATKGKNIKGSHIDLDMGGFIYDALGGRWANELGKTVYDDNRYKYYVKRAEGHNTLVINPSKGEDQNTSTATKTKGSCDIKEKDCLQGELGTIVRFDMSNAYNVTNVDGVLTKNGNSVKRGFMLFENDKRLMIQDEISLDEPGDIYWFMQTLVLGTDYSMSADGKVVIMTKTNTEGQQVRMKAELKAATDNPAANPRFSLMEYKCLEDEFNLLEVNKSFINKYKSYRKLAIHVSGGAGDSIAKVKKATITVVLTPLYEEGDMDKGIDEIIPIANWEMHSDYTSTREMKVSKDKYQVTTPGQIVKSTVTINNVKMTADRLKYTTDNQDMVTFNEDGSINVNNYGNCNITVKSTDYPELSKTFAINAQNVTSMKFNREKIDFTRKISSQIKLTTLPAESKNNDIVWESSDPAVATVDSTGKVTAVGYGKCVIKAYWKLDPNMYVECPVNVLVPQGISIDNSEIKFSKKGTYALNAAITNDDALDKKIIWTSDNEKVATVDENGVVSSVGTGTCNITASCNADKNITAVCAVTVDAPEKVSMNRTSLKMTRLMSYKLSAKVIPNDVSDTGITWKTTNKNVATVEENGKVTTVGNGKCKIIATSNMNKEIYGECDVTVNMPVKIALSKTSIKVTRKMSINLKAKIKPLNAPNKSIKWKSSNSFIASVDKNGKVTVKKSGRVTITATSVANKKIVAVCIVNAKIKKK